MISPDILKKIRQIEIHTKRLLSGLLVGDYSSARKGSGFEFDQIREYQMGDDVRFVDWNSTARTGKLLVKQYIEERNRTVVIALDVSSSGIFSSVDSAKCDAMAKIAAVLSLVADYGKDHASLVLFSDDVEYVIPPGTGRKHIHRIMEALFEPRSGKRLTSLSNVLKHVATMRLKDAVLFLISDFIDRDFEKPLRVAAKKFDLIAIRCLDANEEQLPNVGFLAVRDMETGKLVNVDTRSRGNKSVTGFLKNRLEEQSTLFKKCGIDYLDVAPDRPFVGDIIRFFRRRMMY